MVTGFIIENVETGGIPDKAQIVGTFKNNKLQFKKMYSAQYLSDKNNNLVRNDNKRSQVIKYKGKWDAKKNKFVGRWYIGLDLLRPFFSGAWEMTKKEE